MTHGQRGRVPIPTNEEIAEAEDLHREIVAVSAIQYGPLRRDNQDENPYCRTWQCSPVA
ncbi:MAG: hypothetical protein WB647_13675 [Roseiarcus sp.]